MLNTLTRVTLAVGLLILMVPRGAAAQSSGCQTTPSRVIRYDTVSSGTLVSGWLCRFTARVIDRTIVTCDGAAPLEGPGQEKDYGADILLKGGNAVCAYYKPLYTAWCHGGNVPDATTPTNLTASILSSGEARLAWRDNSGNCSCQGMDCPGSPLPAWQSFGIWRRTETAGYSWIGSVGATTTSYVDPAVPVGQPAFYLVTAHHASYAFSEATGEVLATTNGSPSAGPAVPLGPSVNAEAQPGAVKLGWVDMSTDEAGFRVERRTIGGSWTIVATLPANTTYANDYSIDAGTTYQYRVVAYNSGGASPTGAVQVTTP